MRQLRGRAPRSGAFLRIDAFSAEWLTRGVMQIMRAVVLCTFLAAASVCASACAAISVEAKLAGFDPQWFWTISDENIHGCGMGCRARFVVTTPTEFVGREFEILFHSTPEEERKECPGLGTDIGGTYSFEVPDDFFDKEYKSIHDWYVKKLKRGHNKPVEATSRTRIEDRERSPFEPDSGSVPH